QDREVAQALRVAQRHAAAAEGERPRVALTAEHVGAAAVTGWRVALRRPDAGQLRPGPGGEEHGAEPVAPPDRVIEVDRGVVPSSQRRREQAELQRDRAGG